MPAPKKKFIKKAIKRPGALTQKADAAGMTPTQFAQAHKGDPGQTGAEARFMLNVLKPASKKRKKKKAA